MSFDFLRRLARCLALSALASFGFAALAHAEDVISTTAAPAAPEQATVVESADDPADAETTQALPPAGDEDVDWSVLNGDLAPAGTAIVVHPARRAATTDSSDQNWKRIQGADGSSAVSFNHQLPITWDAHIGAQFAVPPPSAAPTQPLDPQRLLAKPAAQGGSGTGFARLTVPGNDLPDGVDAAIDQASINANVDPLGQQKILGIAASKSLSFADRVKLTLQQGYTMTETTPGDRTAALVPVPGTLFPGATRVYSSTRSARVELQPTGTALSVEGTTASDGTPWQHSVGVQQTVGGGLSVGGSISTTPAGPFSRSLTAQFIQTW